MIIQEASEIAVSTYVILNYMQGALLNIFPTLANLILIITTLHSRLKYYSETQKNEITYPSLHS